MNRKMKVTFEREWKGERRRKREVYREGGEEGERVCVCVGWGLGGFNRSLWHGGCEMRWWNQRIEGREGGKEREIVCQNVDVWRLGFHPAKWLKCSLWHSYSSLSGSLPARDEPRHECEFADGRIEFDLRNVYGWRCNLDRAGSVTVKGKI